ncbi:MAG TPA: UDP-phosphate N-acetylgalactosaminyl-1-phosphate transferase [Terrisporobacter glycolicus]|uniref:UDP-N-acetylgalactosamine-undecaprenyl-phosphate N-acetylgalactosaminephosphotransferase n=1 Tax=Terrisporobacter petrolearius TaxID=1460447 RepID=A0ABZ3FD86_9FIRM|nr:MULTISPECIES: sugar transferase [Terrisporobacter]MBN9647355.1 sugar transferase [Terrisporobacter glycolicus]UPA31517.1 sugar transferase [Terrisporobacter glycolicus]HBI91423.1 UDP-phosphate N-acetylgalactosaminyl-1-phosphate transferase [Terrisporobacter hibernicus]
MMGQYVEKFEDDVCNFSSEISASIDYSIVNDSFLFKIYHRILDIIISIIGLVISIPMIIVFGFLIKKEDGGPIFYKQDRLGKDGKIIFIYKLRSMRINSETNGAIWAEKNDPRITKVGKFIRKTRIDEIPQFLNILKGEMSVIGPRPERPTLTMEFNDEIPGFINRLVVKPGLTGYAQVHGGYEISPEDKIKEDLYYIKNRSVFLDLSILFKTVKVIFTGEGAR